MQSSVPSTLLKELRKFFCGNSQRLTISRNSHQWCSLGKGVLRNFTQACNFIKKEALALVFSCEVCEISKSTFLKNTSGRLLLYFYKEVLSQIFEMVLNTEAVPQRCFVKKVVLQILENSQEKPVIESLKEETLAQVFSCEF